MSSSEHIKAAVSRRESRRSRRAAAKEIRSGDLKGKAKRTALKANRVAHKTARKAARTERKASKQSAKITKRQLKDAWKARRKTVSVADRSFHKSAAKQKQMKEWEYYDKYVK